MNKRAVYDQIKNLTLCLLVVLFFFKGDTLRNHLDKKRSRLMSFNGRKTACPFGEKWDFHCMTMKISFFSKMDIHMLSAVILKSQYVRVCDFAP